MKTLPALSLFLVLTVAGAKAQTQESSVLNGMGARSMGGTYTSISAGAQPGGVAVASSGTMIHYAGFLSTFSLQPMLDTDGDGLNDETDGDNDNDRLADLEEIQGTEFSPVTTTDLNNADSDGDGAYDGDESIAGTDPTDPGAFLRILSITISNNLQTVSWIARGNVTYGLYMSQDPDSLPSSYIENVVVSGGSGPWQVRTNSVTDPAMAETQYFTVKAVE